MEPKTPTTFLNRPLLGGDMKLFHVLTKYEGDIRLPERLIDQLPSNVMLSGTIQFREQLPNVRKQLEATGRKVELFRGVHDVASGQMLGCDIFKVGKPVDAFLYVGDGLFHPTALLYENAQLVFYYNPLTGEITQLTEKDVQKIKNKKRAGLSLFYSAEKIGVLISTKPGQNNLPAALELKKRLEADGKQVFVFLSEMIDINQLNNFPFIECWVNTACPRIIEDTDAPMINLWDLRDTTMKGFGVKVV